MRGYFIEMNKSVNGLDEINLESTPKDRFLTRLNGGIDKKEKI